MIFDEEIPENDSFSRMARELQAEIIAGHCAEIGKQVRKSISRSDAELITSDFYR
jgi:hypothetical protein